MKPDSLKARILRYFENVYAENPELWIHKGDIERKVIDAGHLGDTAARELRRLYADGYLDRREKGKSLEYRYSANYNNMKNVGLV